MIKYVIKRILLCIPILLAISLVIFSILNLTPGDPARNKLGFLASEEAVNELREEWGLNDPFFKQYFKYLGGIMRGDLGKSYSTGSSVAKDLIARSKTTFPIMIIGIFCAALIGIPLGMYAAIKQYSMIDMAAQATSLLFQAVPGFLVGMLLMLIFGLKLKWLPTAGSNGPIYFVLPCATVVFGGAAAIVRMTRSSMLEVIRMDYVRTARAKGVFESEVFFKHCLRNALLPVLTSIGSTLASMISSVVVVESVFAINGLGSYLRNGILGKDIPAVMGMVLLMATFTCVVNLIVDLSYAFIDPRIKAQYIGR